MRRILIVGQETLWRAGLGAILRDAFRDCVVDEIADAEQVRAEMEGDAPPALITVDPSLDGLNQIADIAALRVQYPRVKIAVVSESFENKAVLKLLDAGVNGVIPLDMSYDDLALAFDTVLSDRVYVPSSLVNARTMEAEAGEPEEGDSQPELTPRQKEVLSILATGRSNKEIATALRISENTVKVHLAAVFRQLGVNNRVRAINILQGRSAQNDEDGGIILRAAGGGGSPSAARVQAFQ